MTLDHGHIFGRDCWCNPYFIENGKPLVMASSAVFSTWHTFLNDGRVGVLVHVGESSARVMLPPSDDTGQVI